MSKKQKEVKPLLLDLGCGDSKREGFIGVDIAKTPSVDIVYDLTKFPWKFAKTESVSEVFASHFVEHLDGPERIKFMDEVYRILVPGGKATFITPYYNSVRASQDPTHKWPPVSENTYLYFNKAWRDQNKLSHYPIKCDFDFGYGYAQDPLWATRSQESRDFANKHYTNAILDLQVVLKRR